MTRHKTISALAALLIAGGALVAGTTAAGAATAPAAVTTTATTCSGTDGVITAYVARNPGFIVVNGGLNLMDHLWTTNLNAGNTTFAGGLVNWFQTGLLVSWTGTADPVAGCILDHLTVSPASPATPPPPPASYTAADEGKGKITSVDPQFHFVMVGTKKLIWSATTTIKVHTPSGVVTVVDGSAKPGMRVQWKGLRDTATNTVLTRQLEIN